MSLATLILGATLPLTAAGAPPDKGLVDIFQARYAAMKTTMAARDANAIASLLAPGFVSEDVEGKTENSDTMIRQVTGLPLDPNKASETTIESVQLKGDMATVVQRYHMTTTKLGPGTQPPKTVDLVTSSTDTWININSRWLIQKTVTTRLDYKLDGRLLVHKQRAPRGLESHE